MSWIERVLIQHREQTKCRRIVHLTKSHFMFCEFYLKKKNTKVEFLFFFNLAIEGCPGPPGFQP